MTSSINKIEDFLNGDFTGIISYYPNQCMHRFDVVYELAINVGFYGNYSSYGCFFNLHSIYDGSKGMIEFRNGSFAYDNGKKVLDGLNCTVGKGHVVALVGPSEAEKVQYLCSCLVFILLGKVKFELRASGSQITLGQKDRPKHSWVLTSATSCCLKKGTNHDDW